MMNMTYYISALIIIFELLQFSVDFSDGSSIFGNGLSDYDLDLNFQQVHDLPTHRTINNAIIR